MVVVCCGKGKARYGMNRIATIFFLVFCKDYSGGFLLTNGIGLFSFSEGGGIRWALFFFFCQRMGLFVGRNGLVADLPAL